MRHRLLCCFLFAGSAFAQPVVSAEWSLDLLSTGPAYDEQKHVASAAGGASWLMVWQDNRVYILDQTIVGTVVSAAGAVSPPTNFVVHAEPGADHIAPAVAFGGGQYLVVWTSGNFVKAKRVSTAGVVLDPAPLTVSNATNSYPADPVVAFDGTNFLVAWSDYRNASSANNYSHSIYAGRVSPGLAALEVNGFQVTPTAPGRDQIEPALTARGADVYLSWSDARNSTGSTFGYDIYGTRVSGASVLDTGGVAICTAAGDQRTSSGSHGAGTTLVVWQDQRVAYNRNIFGARVNAAGAVLDATGFQVAPADVGSSTSKYGPRAGFDGTQFLVLWDTYSAVRGARVSTAGVVLDAAALPVTTASTQQQRLTMAFNGTYFLVAWEDRRTLNNSPSYIDVWGLRVLPSGVAVDPPAPYARAAAHQSHSAVAKGNGQLLAVWEDDRPDGVSRIWGTRLSATGQPLDPNGLALSPASGDHFAPSVSFDGQQYWVAWWSRGSDSVQAVRVSSAGALLDAAPISIGQGNAPSVASSSAVTLVTFARKPSGQTGNVYGLRLSAAGTRLDAAPFAVASSYDDESNPDVVFDGAGFFAVWQVGTSSPVKGTQISTGGAVSAPIAVSGSIAGNNPSVAFGGSQYVVTWNTPNGGGSGANIYAARVSLTGNVLNTYPIQLTQVLKLRYQTDVSFDGSSFVIAWHGYASVGSSFDYQIEAARLSPAGAVLDQPVVLVAKAAQFYTATVPALAQLGPGKTLVLYDLEDAAPAVAATRVRARSFEVATAPACTSSAGCASGFCVDGLCCDSACGGGVAGDCQACSIAAGGSVDGQCKPSVSGMVCRASAGTCDSAEVCNGTAPTCPADGKVSNGMPCNDGDGCTLSDHCQAGACVSTSRLTCQTATACKEDGVCNPATGTCSAANKQNGTACDDGNACTQSDTCQSGSCGGRNPVQCIAKNSCHSVGVCAPATGVCSEPQRPDGTACGAGGAQCVAGGCVTPDAGVVDGGVDAGVTDAGAPDAGQPWVPNPNTGPGPAFDAGTGPGTSPSGCGCASSGPSTLGAWLFALGAIWASRRRSSAAASRARRA
ncbi:MAG: hypothetical protein ACYC8T_00130 [Myxococcaceae bacterium]